MIPRSLQDSLSDRALESRIDPITLRYCKNPFRVTTSDGRYSYQEPRTIILAFEQQYNQKGKFGKILELLNSRRLHLVTLKGCFSVIAGKKITQICPLGKYETYCYHTIRKISTMIFKEQIIEAIDRLNLGLNGRYVQIP